MMPPPLYRPMQDQNLLPTPSNPSGASAQAPPSPGLDTTRAGPERQSDVFSPIQAMPDEQRASLKLTQMDSRHSEMMSRLGTHRTSVVPGRGSVLRGSLISGIELQDPSTQTSMHDAAVDVLQTTYPLAFPTVQSTQGMESYVGKGKGRSDAPAASQTQSEQSAPPPPILSAPAASTVPRMSPAPVDRYTGFWMYHDPSGISTAVCSTCTRVCPQPDQHRTLAGGGGCIDIGMPSEP
jgi:hypothetical protein